MSLFVVAVGVVMVGIFIFNVTERVAPDEQRFLTKMFEVVSAFNTVGLSMGMTPELSPVGKGTTILLMFLGRPAPTEAVVRGDEVLHVSRIEHVRTPV
jgi:trk system potassium uptake protein